MNKMSLRFPQATRTPPRLLQYTEDERRGKNVNLIREENQPSVLPKDAYPSQNALWLQTQALSLCRRSHRQESHDG